jgi:hypothetical protein
MSHIDACGILARNYAKKGAQLRANSFLRRMPQKYQKLGRK